MANNSQEGKHLEPVDSQSTLKDIADFITEQLQKTFHHWNQLKNYRNSIHEFKDSLNDAVMIDINFSEKLKPLTKFQAQSQH